jgi:hypothetical protein
MSAGVEDIRRDIDHTRVELDRKIGLIEGKVHAAKTAVSDAFDIRHQVSRRPWTMVGVSAAESTGYQYKKFWSTSGLPGIRPTHIDAENYSNEVNGLMPNQVFPNGLLYPGDHSGPPEEVINCRCVVLHEII